MFLRVGIRWYTQHILFGWLALGYASSAHAESYWLGRSSQVWNPLAVRQVCRISRDGVSTSSFPLTHNPSCVRAPLPNGTDTIMEDFCVYTNSFFSNGRGISLITTPEVFSDMTAEVYYDEESRVNNEDHLYVERQTAGRGTGLFAQRSFIAGETYMVKTPVLLIARAALEVVPREDGTTLLRQAVNQLPVYTQELLMNLAKSKGSDEINDMVQTNSMRLDFAGVKYLGVIPEAARVNHVCRQNSYYRFHDFSMTLEVFAIRNVDEGEEFSFSYGLSDQPHDIRQQAIKANWEFTCKCALCNAPKADIEASDKRLARIAELKYMLPTEPNKGPHLIVALPELIDLMTEEGLIVDRPQYEEILAYAWNAYGDDQRAKEWAGRARMGWEIIAGKGSWEVKRMKNLEEHPKQHQSWNMWEEYWHEDDDHNDAGHDHDHDHDHHH
ncbi:hypothetical protein EJ04DRAFT_434374 [Polyplosphaeria fusca]|uniref:SET domain-containing protein n=1 Tax=Polyplosphaeria fusca TaxID=682080 RepID=A0A9P4R2U6_9PLEO|nr:hypothetical protein EJ04DRAFT_434374 [Polyplosphaeria fusca]